MTQRKRCNKMIKNNVTDENNVKDIKDKKYIKM